MVARRFGAENLFQDVDTVLLEGAANTNSTMNIRFVNRNPVTIHVRLALVDAPAATAIADLEVEDFLEWDAPIGAQDVLEELGIVVPAGFSIVVRSDENDVNVVAYGFEENCI